LKRPATHLGFLARTENISTELHNSNTNMAWWCHRSACQKEDLYRLSRNQNMHYIIHIRSCQFQLQKNNISRHPLGMLILNSNIVTLAALAHCESIDHHIVHKIQHPFDSSSGKKQALLQHARFATETS
jgi:hypothetical protein